MSIFDIKKGFLGGRRPKRAPAPPSKEEKKDTSAFGKSGFLPPDKARGLLMRDKDRLFREYSFKGSDVERLAKEITDKKFGPLTNPADLKRFEGDRRKEINKIPNLDAREKTKKSLEKDVKILKDIFLGKK